MRAADDVDSSARWRSLDPRGGVLSLQHAAGVPSGGGGEGLMRVLVIALVIAGGVSSRAAQPPQGPPAIPVEIAPVRVAALADASEYLALLRPRHSVQVQPQVSGHVTRIAVVPGDRVAR